MDQKEHWRRLRQSIHDAVDAIDASNVREIGKALLSVNIDRGSGLLCRYLVENSLNDHSKCAVYACAVDIVASQFPKIGELLAVRLAVLFKKAYVENDYAVVRACSAFLCELTLQKLVEDVLILQVLQVLLDKRPSLDSVRVAEQVLLRVGGRLQQTSAAAANVVFDRLRVLLQLGNLSNATLRCVGALLRARRDGLMLKVDPRLDVVPEEDKACCLVDLSETLDPQTHLNFFQEDPEFEATERAYEELKSALWPEEELEQNAPEPEKSEIVTDMSDAQLIQRQKSIYLRIMSSMSADEAVHKLIKLLRQGSFADDMLVDMVVKCCAQEKTYSKYFGVIGEIVCRLSSKWQQTVTQQFREKYDTIFQFEGAQLRNIGKFFGHLLAADVLAVSDTLGHIVLTEQETSSAGRVFIKFVFQEMVEELGIAEVQKIMQDPAVVPSLRNLFPLTDVTTADADHIMFSINYFTAIGLGILTEQMRHTLKNLPEEPRGRKRSRRSSSGSLGSRSRMPLGSYSTSLSRSHSRLRSRSFSRSPSRSRSRSWSRSPSRSRRPSRSPPQSRSPTRS